MPESSSRAKRTQVLVVGAGPVGLVAALRLREQGVDARIVEKHAEQGTHTSLEWSAVAEFRHALVDHFGAGRVWLAGEAAHLTGPLGVQSLNIGIDEANELTLRIGDSLRHPSRPAFGDEFDQKRRQQWRQLLGLEERASLGNRSPDWAWRHLGRLLSCLPASGGDLDDLLAQLRLTPSAHPSEAGAPI